MQDLTTKTPFERLGEHEGTSPVPSFVHPRGARQRASLCLADPTE